MSRKGFFTAGSLLWLETRVPVVRAVFLVSATAAYWPVAALIVATASSLTRVFHVYEVFYVGQAFGVLVMFGGFLAAQRVPRRAANLNPAPSR